MARVKLDYSNISSNAIPSINNLISSVNKAINYLEQDNVPSDFSSRSTFNSVLSDLKKQYNELVKVKEWLVNSNKNYDTMINKLEQQAVKLPTYQVKKRNTII